MSPVWKTTATWDLLEGGHWILFLSSLVLQPMSLPELPLMCSFFPFSPCYPLPFCLSPHPLQMPRSFMLSSAGPAARVLGCAICREPARGCYIPAQPVTWVPPTCPAVPHSWHWAWDRSQFSHHTGERPRVGKCTWAVSLPVSTSVPVLRAEMALTSQPCI